MTDLAALIEKLGDCPMTEEYVAFQHVGGTGFYERADAALLELAQRAESAEAIAAGQRQAYIDTKISLKEAQEKVADMEGVLAAAKNAEYKTGGWDIAKQEIALREQAEAEVERLRVCGNCSRRYRFHSDDQWPECHEGLPSDHCHFTPSRWAAREEAGE